LRRGRRPLELALVPGEPPHVDRERGDEDREQDHRGRRKADRADLAAAARVCAQGHHRHDYFPFLSFISNWSGIGCSKLLR
jgi:hypothetical protein